MEAGDFRCWPIRLLRRGNALPSRQLSGRCRHAVVALCVERSPRGTTDHTGCTASHSLLAPRHWLSRRRSNSFAQYLTLFDRAPVGRDAASNVRISARLSSVAGRRSGDQRSGAAVSLMMVAWDKPEVRAMSVNVHLLSFEDGTSQERQLAVA